jgi:hypothetical protein
MEKIVSNPSMKEASNKYTNVKQINNLLFDKKLLSTLYSINENEYENKLIKNISLEICKIFMYLNLIYYHGIYVPENKDADKDADKNVNLLFMIQSQHKYFIENCLSIINYNLKQFSEYKNFKLLMEIYINNIKFIITDPTKIYETDKNKIEFNFNSDVLKSELFKTIYQDNINNIDNILKQDIKKEKYDSWLHKDKFIYNIKNIKIYAQLYLLLDPIIDQKDKNNYIMLMYYYSIFCLYYIANGDITDSNLLGSGYNFSLNDKTTDYNHVLLNILECFMNYYVKKKPCTLKSDNIPHDISKKIQRNELLKIILSYIYNKIIKISSDKVYKLVEKLNTITFS